MSRNLAFWRLPEEEESFLRLLASVQETVVYPILRAPTRKDLAPVSMEDYIPTWQPGTILHARSKTKVTIRSSRTGPRRRFTILGYASEAVQYRSGRLIDDDGLEGNYLQYHTYYLGKDDNWVHFDKDFVKWGDRLRLLIRMNTIEWENRRFTEKAYQAVQKKQFELVC